MLPAKIRLAALCIALLGCGSDRPAPPELPEVFPKLPLPPQPTFVSKSGGAGALQVTLRSPVGAQAVADYYRRVLSQDGWRLVNEAKDGAGAVVLYAEQDGPPLWVRIRDDRPGAGSLVELAGAIVASDSAKPAGKPAS